MSTQTALSFQSFQSRIVQAIDIVLGKRSERLSNRPLSSTRSIELKVLVCLPDKTASIKDLSLALR
jgi:hypothetical protein